MDHFKGDPLRRVTVAMRSEGVQVARVPFAVGPGGYGSCLHALGQVNGEHLLGYGEFHLAAPHLLAIVAEACRYRADLFADVISARVELNGRTGLVFDLSNDAQPLFSRSAYQTRGGA